MSEIIVHTENSLIICFIKYSVYILLAKISSNLTFGFFDEFGEDVDIEIDAEVKFAICGDPDFDIDPPPDCFVFH